MSGEQGGRFARDTAVTPVGPGRYDARIDRGWWIQRGPNGGYLAAIVLRAMAAEVDVGRLPRSLTIHYLRPPSEGEAGVVVDVERAGRTLTTVSARLEQSGVVQAIAVAAFATDREGASEFDHVDMPDVAAPDACAPGLGAESIVAIHDRYETRRAIGGPIFVPGDEALTGGWIRLADGEPADSCTVAALTDAWPPAVFTLAPVPLAVPTVDLTVHFRRPVADPAGWFLVRFRTRLSKGGYLEEDGEVWSEDGQLLAQSRQLAVAAPVG